MGCPTDAQLEQLSRALGGATNDRVSEGWRRHMEECPVCRQKLEALRQESQVIRDIRELWQTRREVQRLLDSTERPRD